MIKRNKFYALQAKLVVNPEPTLLEKTELRTLGISAMGECAKEAQNIEKLITHTLGDDYVDGKRDITR